MLFSNLLQNFYLIRKEYFISIFNIIKHIIRNRILLGNRLESSKPYGAQEDKKKT